MYNVWNWHKKGFSKSHRLRHNSMMCANVRAILVDITPRLRHENLHVFIPWRNWRK